MGIPINRGDIALALARFFGLKGNVTLQADQTVVPVAVIGDLSEPDPITAILRLEETTPFWGSQQITAALPATDVPSLQIWNPDKYPNNVLLERVELEVDAADRVQLRRHDPQPTSGTAATTHESRTFLGTGPTDGDSNIALFAFDDETNLPAFDATQGMLRNFPGGENITIPLGITLPPGTGMTIATVDGAAATINGVFFWREAPIAS